MRSSDILKDLLIKLDRPIREYAGHIITIHLALGELLELDQNILQQQWNELVKGTSAEHAQVHIRLIPAEVQCMACFSQYHPVDKKILCPHCGSFGAKILSGEEFKFESIETEHE